MRPNGKILKAFSLRLEMRSGCLLLLLVCNNADGFSLVQSDTSKKWKYKYWEERNKVVTIHRPHDWVPRHENKTYL